MSTASPDSIAELAQDFPQATRAEWLKLVDKVLKGADFERRLVSRTADGIAVQPLYGRAERPEGAPRPLPAQGLGAGPWDIRQRHGEADAKATNAAILDDLAGGVTSVLIAIEAPGQAGLPATPEALAAALSGVLLEACGVAFMAGEAAPAAAKAMAHVWTAAGIAPGQRRGAFNFDPLGTLALTGTLAARPEAALAAAADLVAETQGLAGVTALLADGRPYHEAGASEAQELAAMLATLVAYLRACEGKGIVPSLALENIAVGLAADADLFATMAKLRAARRLVVRVAEACGATRAGAAVPFDVTTSERMLAPRDPWVNILRTATATAGAAFGGASAITVLPYSWALGRPDAFARRVARNTHLVLQEESSLARVADPAGGAFFVEKLTDDLAAAAWARFQDIERKGGILAVLSDGSLQAEIATTAAERAKRIATGREALTGVSAFPLLGDDGVKVVPHAKAPPIAAGAVTVKPLAPRRLSAPFDALRDAADAYAARTGSRPRIHLAALGDLAVHSARTTWMRNFLAAGGIEAVGGEGAHNSADAGRLFADSGATVACLCSSDTVYGELGEAAAGALKAAGAKVVLLAGRPKDQEAALTAAGVDTFVYAGIDAIDALTALHKALGVQ